VVFLLANCYRWNQAQAGKATAISLHSISGTIPPERRTSKTTLRERRELSLFHLPFLLSFAPFAHTFFFLLSFSTPPHPPRLAVNNHPRSRPLSFLTTPRLLASSPLSLGSFTPRSASPSHIPLYPPHIPAVRPCSYSPAHTLYSPGQQP